MLLFCLALARKKLCMGDLQAVEIGQLSHACLVARAGVLNDSELIARELPFPRGDYFGGI